MTNKTNSYGGLAGLTAIAASLCCIAPVLAFVAGIGGMASTFSWLEPFRPYLIGSTILVLGFAWYQKLKPKKDIDCDCDEETVPFMQTRTFLAIVTVFAGLMLAFPYYSSVFYPDTPTSNIVVNQDNLKKVEFSISGMTCTGCEEHITHAIIVLDGIQSVNASYEKENAIVHFDETKTSKAAIAEAINSTGYKITD